MGRKRKEKEREAGEERENLETETIFQKSRKIDRTPSRSSGKNEVREVIMESKEMRKEIVNEIKEILGERMR